MRHKRASLMAFVLVAFAIASCHAMAADNVVFVFDASNSMNKPLDGDVSRFDAAVSAMSNVLTALPSEIDVGLLLYGWRIGWQNEVESCKDLELVYAIQPLTADLRLQMIDTLASIVPQGKTPLADALVRAADALAGLGGDSAIVLLSDGEGNCGGNHNAAAHYLASMQPPIELHVIGLDLDSEARATLEMMVDVTGGTYRGVEEAGSLADALYAAAVGTALVQRAVPSQTTAAAPSGMPGDFSAYGITNTVWGTEGNDVLYGTDGNDLIYGLGGDDFIVGYAGNDIILAGPGDDIVQGLEGCDVLYGEEGCDILLGGDDDDQLCGGAGNDSLEGEAGNDCLDGGQGDDRLLGGSGRNQLVESGGCDIMLEGTVTQLPCPACACQATCFPELAPVCPTPSAPVMVPAAQPSCPPTQAAQPSCPPPPAVGGNCASPRILKTVDEGAQLQLHGFVTDEDDCGVAAVEWTVSRGSLSDPCSLDPIFYAPMTAYCEGENVLVRLVAQDRCGATGEDCFLIHINNVNRPPCADAGPDICVNEGATVRLTCEGTDPDGDPVCYSWCDASGRGHFDDSTALHPAYTAPMTGCCAGEEFVLTLTVTDSCGLSTTDSMVVRVANVNRPPCADAGPDLCVNEGAAVRLTCEGTDPDGDPVRYSWCDTSGCGRFDDPTALHPVYTAPMTACCEGENIVLTLTVTDSCGLATTDSMVVHVANVNRPPCADAGPDVCVDEGTTVRLIVSGSDPDGDPVSYRWCDTSGRGFFADPTALHTTYTVPMTACCEGENIVLTLTVTDSCGLATTDSVIVHINNVNKPPAVIADP